MSDTAGAPRPSGRHFWAKTGTWKEDTICGLDVQVSTMPKQLKFLGLVRSTLQIAPRCRGADLRPSHPRPTSTRNEDFGHRKRRARTCALLEVAAVPTCLHRLLCAGKRRHFRGR